MLLLGIFFQLSRLKQEKKYLFVKRETSGGMFSTCTLLVKLLIKKRVFGFTKGILYKKKKKVLTNFALLSKKLFATTYNFIKHS